MGAVPARPRRLPQLGGILPLRGLRLAQSRDPQERASVLKAVTKSTCSAPPHPRRGARGCVVGHALQQLLNVDFAWGTELLARGNANCGVGEGGDAPREGALSGQERVPPLPRTYPEPHWTARPRPSRQERAHLPADTRRRAAQLRGPVSGGRWRGVRCRKERMHCPAHTGGFPANIVPLFSAGVLKLANKIIIIICKAYF